MTAAPTALSLGIVACGSCSAVHRLPQPVPARLVCTRCHARMASRKPASIARSWAFLIAAAILYFPANLLPMMRTETLLRERSDTILSGIVTLWRAGTPEIAVIVFVASIMVPILKIVMLALLLLTAQHGSTWDRAQRTQLYRAIEFIGYWSMLDVFVVALLVAALPFGNFASVHPGSGIVAFAIVVVLTMLASKSFDPRLIWDDLSPKEDTAMRSPQ
jgi:paraquat-inducible protein A